VRFPSRIITNHNAVGDVNGSSFFCVPATRVAIRIWKDRIPEKLEVMKGGKIARGKIVHALTFHSRACRSQILIKPLRRDMTHIFGSVALEGKFSRGNYLFSWLDSDRIRAYWRMCVYKPRVHIGAADNTGRFDANSLVEGLMMIRARWKDRNCLWLNEKSCVARIVCAKSRGDVPRK